MMSTNLQTQASNDASQSDGGVWYELHSEQEQICEALLRVSSASAQPADFHPETSVGRTQLQDRLRMIDDALDRLMAGTYGDCVICGTWIEDHKLHADPALPFCCGCQRRSENKDAAPRIETKQMQRAFLPDQPSHHARRAWDG